MIFLSVQLPFELMFQIPVQLLLELEPNWLDQNVNWAMYLECRWNNPLWFYPIKGEEEFTFLLVYAVKRKITYFRYNFFCIKTFTVLLRVKMTLVLDFSKMVHYRTKNKKSIK